MKGKRNLNTSHVLIYLQLRLHAVLRISRFKYISCSYLSPLQIQFCLTCAGFKYISCSYLSNGNRQIYTSCRHLNTSHVLIYPTQQIVQQYPDVIFKYISCSYLSSLMPDNVQAALIFKYISCSYLSISVCAFFCWT